MLSSHSWRCARPPPERMPGEKRKGTAGTHDARSGPLRFRTLRPGKPGPWQSLLAAFHGLLGRGHRPVVHRGHRRVIGRGHRLFRRRRRRRGFLLRTTGHSDHRSKQHRHCQQSDIPHPSCSFPCRFIRHRIGLWWIQPEIYHLRGSLQEGSLIPRFLQSGGSPAGSLSRYRPGKRRSTIRSSSPSEK